jgi:MATE family multidrug resistance protein
VADAGESSTPTLRDEVRASGALALPIVLAQLGMMAIGTVDIIMVGHHSGEALASVAIGHVYLWALMVFGLGVLSSIDPIVAQSVGAGDGDAARRGIQRGLVLAVILAIPTTAATLVAEPVLRWLQQPPEAIPAAVDFVVWSAPGLLPFFVFGVLRLGLQALACTRPILWTLLLANLLNAGLDWILIYGAFGAPALGARGAAIASSISRLVLAVGLLWIAMPVLRPYLRPWDVRSLQPRALWRTFVLGCPIGLQMTLEIGAFALSAMLVGRFGAAPIAGHQVAINLASISFMVPLGIAGAAAVRVGHAVGRGDASGARQAAAVAMTGGALCMLCFAMLFLAAPAWLAAAYTRAADVAQVAITLVPIAGVFQVFDGVQVTAAGVLRGMADTRAAMWINLVGFWAVGLPLGAVLAFAAGLGPGGVWWGLVAGLGVVGCVLSVRVAVRMRRPLARVQID